MAAPAQARKCLLACLAHPDDESFGFGGTLAYYSARGVDVHLVCATRGEAGTVDERFLEGYASVAALREAELRCAVQQLRLTSLALLDYRDSGMAGTRENQHPQALVNAPLEEVAEKLVGHMRRLKPQVVITFDSVGGYHHPDHIAIHKATLMAFEAAEDARVFPEAGEPFAPEKLYTNALSRARIRRIIRTMRLTGKDPTKVGRNKDIDLTELARDADTPRHVVINYRSVDGRKRAADACHASQLDGSPYPLSSLVELFRRLVGRRDAFTRLYPPAGEGYRAPDLFAE